VEAIIAAGGRWVLGGGGRLGFMFIDWLIRLARKASVNILFSLLGGHSLGIQGASRPRNISSYLCSGSISPLMWDRVVLVQTVAPPHIHCCYASY